MSQIPYNKNEILNCLNLSDYCFENDDKTILKLLNENIDSHEINQVISGVIESTYQNFTIAFREKCNEGESCECNEFKKRNTYYICCKGTDFYKMDDILTDLNAIKLLIDDKDHKGTYHKGFHKRAKLFPIQKIIQWLNQGDNVILTGHSLGGAISQILCISILLKFKFNLSNLPNHQSTSSLPLMCITFGSPIIGGKDLYENLIHQDKSNKLIQNVFHNFIHTDDPIPKLIGLDKQVLDLFKYLLIKSVSWYFNGTTPTLINNVINYFTTPSTSTISIIPNKSPSILFIDFQCFLGTYYILSENKNEEIKILSHLNDFDELNSLLNFKSENLFSIISHKLFKYRRILELNNNSGSNNITKNSCKKSNSINGINKTNQVELLSNLIPKVSNFIIKNCDQEITSKLLIIDGENLCFTSISSMKFIYKDKKEFNILSTSIIQKGYYQIIIDITNIPNNNSNNQLDKFQFNSIFKIENNQYEFLIK